MKPHQLGKVLIELGWSLIEYLTHIPRTDLLYLHRLRLFFLPLHIDYGREEGRDLQHLMEVLDKQWKVLYVLLVELPQELALDGRVENLASMRALVTVAAVDKTVNAVVLLLLHGVLDLLKIYPFLAGVYQDLYHYKLFPNLFLDLHLSLLNSVKCDIY